MNEKAIQKTDFCVCCGEPITEGEMVCYFCREKYSSKHTDSSLISGLWEQAKNIK